MQKSHVLPIVQRRKHVVFARIPYQMVHKNIASTEGASESLRYFRPESEKIPSIRDEDEQPPGCKV